MGRRLVDSQDVDDIEREERTEQEMRDKLFEVWKRRRGSGATYRVVMKAFNDVKNQQAAEMLKDLLSSIPQGRQCMPYISLLSCTSTAIHDQQELSSSLQSN